MAADTGSFQEGPKLTSRGLRRLLQADERVFHRASFALYGLPATWKGHRLLGGFHQTRRGLRWMVTGAQLSHEDPQDEERVLNVTASVPGPDESWPSAGRKWEMSVRDWERGWDDLTEDDDEGDGDTEPSLVFGKEPILVDGSRVAFDVASQGEEWLGGAYVGEVWLELYGYRFPPSVVELRRITDITPYAEGTRRLHGL